MLSSCGETGGEYTDDMDDRTSIIVAGKWCLAAAPHAIVCFVHAWNFPQSKVFLRDDLLYTKHGPPDKAGLFWALLYSSTN